MSTMAKKKVYVVVKGHTPGLYHDFETYQEQVHGYKGAVSKSFKKEQDAQHFFDSQVGTKAKSSSTSNNNGASIENRSSSSSISSTASSKKRKRNVEPPTIIVRVQETIKPRPRKNENIPTKVILSCIRKEICHELQQQKNDANQILSWPSSHNAIPMESEQAMLPILLKYGKREKGMMKDHPTHRIRKIKNACREYGMTIEQALSMRRTHIHLLNPYRKERLNLGDSIDINTSAQRYEDAVGKYLEEKCICFASEKNQIGEITPDFLFPFSVNLQLTSTTTCTSKQEENDQEASEKCVHVQINWLEAKMFYGASTIPDGTKNAVGAILPKAKRYAEKFGPGAMVFSFGCGERLKVALQEIHVTVLDSYPLDLRYMRGHQQTWCANDNGEILP